MCVNFSAWGRLYQFGANGNAAAALSSARGSRSAVHFDTGLSHSGKLHAVFEIEGDTGVLISPAFDVSSPGRVAFRMRPREQADTAHGEWESVRGLTCIIFVPFLLFFPAVLHVGNSQNKKTKKKNIVGNCVGWIRARDVRRRGYRA